MYEELISPIPDLSAYLSRLGIPEGEHASLIISLDTLNRLVYAHHTHIPFEDLDVCLLNRTPSLAVADLFDKLVTRRRGGYCFEMNGLFTRLLCELGFTAASVFCRIVRGRELPSGSPLPPCTHRGILVTLPEGVYFCDVGFGGPMPPFAVPLLDKESVFAHGDTFQPRKLSNDWWCLSRLTSEGTTEDVLHFSTVPQEMSEFLPVNFFCSNNPPSLFRTHLLVNLRTAEGSLSLTDRALTIRNKGDVRVIELENDEALYHALERYFGIKKTSIPNGI